LQHGTVPSLRCKQGTANDYGRPDYKRRPKNVLHEKLSHASKRRFAWMWMPVALCMYSAFTK